MRTRDYRVLKYIKRHPEVTRENLYKKFDFLEKDYEYVSPYLKIDNKQRIVEDGMDTGKEEVVGSSTYVLNHAGYEKLEKKRHDTWLFWFPYVITTIIATISATPTIVKIVKFICNLFQP